MAWAFAKAHWLGALLLAALARVAAWNGPCERGMSLRAWNGLCERGMSLKRDIPFWEVMLINSLNNLKRLENYYEEYSQYYH